MTDHDIHALLDIACTPQHGTPPDPATRDVGTQTVTGVSGLATADLRRAHSMKARRRARYAALSAAGLAIITVGGLGVTGLRGGAPGLAANDPYATTHHDKNTNSHPPAPAIRLVAKHLDADPYTFATTPAGWAVQGSTPFAVTIAPIDGSVSDNPADFSGKLIIMLAHGNQSGDSITYAGRDFVKRGDSGYTTLVTHTRPGEPHGWVTVQFPNNTGWTTDTMLRFLSTVHVTPSAQAGRG
jgi:hypothetical protein